MLDAKGIRRFNASSGLTGTPTGEEARSTNWDIVEPLTHLSKQALLKRCQDILK